MRFFYFKDGKRMFVREGDKLSVVPLDEENPDPTCITRELTIVTVSRKIRHPNEQTHGGML